MENMQLFEHVNTKAIFGEPIERNGLTVIPVARARWGQGLRGGNEGGGVMMAPVGFIEVCEDKATFRRIRTARPWLVGAIFLGAAALRLWTRRYMR